MKAIGFTKIGTTIKINMNKILNISIIAFLCLYTSSCITGIPSPPNYNDPKFRAASEKLPQTTALDKELRLTHKSLNATSGRTKKAKSTVTNGRYAAEASVKMIDQIPSVEKQMSRLDRELKSISRIPQFKLLKPVSTGVTGLAGKVRSIREKAEKLRDKQIKPAIKKMKSLEAKLTKLKTGLDFASAETVTAVRHINLLRNFVMSQQYPDLQVRTLEAASKTARYPVSPAQKAISEFDSACTDLENQVNSYKALLTKLTSLEPGLDKVKTKMKPIDDKMKGIAKVLDKKIEFKIPLSKGKKVSFTVRKVIEAPGKVLEIAVKPLTKIAEKLLKPITKNLKFDIKPPKEIQKISDQLNALTKFPLNIDRPTLKFDSPVNTQSMDKYRAELKKFSAAKLTGMPAK